MTSRFLRSFLLLLTMLATSVLPHLAQGRGQGNPHKQKDNSQVDQNGRDRDQDQDRDDAREHGRTRPVFRERDRNVISTYFRTRTSGLPPGLAKRNGSLPPGLEKQLERNGTLPPGLQKRVQPLPPDLERRLPRLPVIYRRGTIGPDAIILNTKTGAIMDIIRGVATVAGK